MSKKRLFTGLLALLLVFAFLGCDQIFKPDGTGDTGITPPPL